VQLKVKTPWAQESRIQDMQAIGGSQDKDS
jgi:hypothetical protein